MIKQLSINNEILDIENILTKDIPYITEYNSNNSEGYIKYSNGYLKQWTTVQLTDTTTEFTLKYPYKDSSYSVIICNREYSIDNDLNNQIFAYYINSKEKFTILALTTWSTGNQIRLIMEGFV